MKLLITGGCGFLGTNLAAAALDRGDQLLVLDNLSRLGSSQNLSFLQNKGKSFQFYENDIRDIKAIEALIEKEKPEAIFHLAGQVAMTTSIANPRLDFEVNTLGTINVLEGVRKHIPHSPVLYSSTNKVYGDLEDIRYEETDSRYVCTDYPQGFDENLKLNFQSPYGCSKGASDQYMLDYARIFNLNTVVFRHSSIFGGRQFSTADQGWIGWFVLQALETKEALNKKQKKDPFTISGTGKQVRDVLFSTDLVNLYFSALDKIKSIRGQVFNIGGGMENSYSLLELFSALEEIFDLHLEYARLPPRASDQKVFVADIQKAQKLLGWQPQVARKEGLTQMIEWMKESLQ